MTNMEQKTSSREPELKAGVLFRSVIPNVFIAGFCILGLSGSLWFLWKDFNSSGNKQVPVGTVIWKTGTMQRLSSDRIQWERLNDYSVIYNGDTIRTPFFSGALIGLNNGEWLEILENTSVRIQYSTADDTAMDYVILKGFCFNTVDGKSHMIAAEPVGYTFNGQISPHAVVPVFKAGATADSRVKAFAPVNGDVLQFSSQNPAVNFSWEVSGEVSSVLLEIADNSGMHDPVFSRTLHNIPKVHGSFVCSDLGEGVWFWSLLPVDPLTGSVTKNYSEVHSFSISRKTELAAPVLIAPTEETPVLIGSDKGNIYFSWKPEKEAASYTMQVSRYSDMSEPVINRTLAQNHYIYSAGENTIEPGRYYWCVYQTDKNNNRSRPGRVLSFYTVNSATAPHIIFPPDNYIVPSNRSQDISFSWKSTLPETARLQIAERPDFSGDIVFDEKTYGIGRQGCFLYPGIYYWRISAGTPAYSSSPARLVVLPAFEAPGIEIPANNDDVQLTEGSPLYFSWKQVSYADYYTFCLYLEGRDTPLCEITSLRENRLQVHFDRHTVGRFRWTIQAFSSATSDRSKRTGLIGTSYFNVNRENAGVSAVTDTTWSVPRIINILSYTGDIKSSITLLEP